MAKFCHIAVGLSLADFRSIMKSSPHLSKGDADKFADDLSSIRRDAANLMVRDPESPDRYRLES